jgi:hypothetical protein
MAEMAIRAAALPGAALFFAAWLPAAPAHAHGDSSSAPPDPELLKNYRPQFFGPEDFRALEAFTVILIPTDETPGAREAHCAHFIDFVLQASGEMAKTQATWREAMAHIKATGFYDADGVRRLELVKQMARPETDATAAHPAFAAYRLIKQQTAFAFYTSRQGMIETLDYKGNSYNITFPACNHPEHQTV